MIRRLVVRLTHLTICFKGTLLVGSIDVICSRWSSKKGGAYSAADAFPLTSGVVVSNFEVHVERCTSIENCFGRITEGIKVISGKYLWGKITNNNRGAKVISFR